MHRIPQGSSDTAHTAAFCLDFEPPLEWQALLAFLAARAIPGVEVVHGDVYRRTVRLPDASGWIEARPAADAAVLQVTVAPTLAGAVEAVRAKIRALFDLAARPATIDSHLAGDALLAPLVARRPGLRIPGAFDGFETAIRAVLGQQVSVRAATTLSGRLVERYGEVLATPLAGLSRLFPTAAVLAAVSEEDIATLGMPRSRARTVRVLACAVADGIVRLERGALGADMLERLAALPGVGDWTVQYIAMRVLGNGDAFLAGDLGLRKALGGMSARDITRRAEPWRPWRGYAAMHLWAGLGDAPMKG